MNRDCTSLRLRGGGGRFYKMLDVNSSMYGRWPTRYQLIETFESEIYYNIIVNCYKLLLFKKNIK